MAETRPRTRDQENVGWTPVLSDNGEIYCSPGCGGRCKKADFDLATERADRLCEQLGDGWNPQVWENLGWHYSVVLDLRRDRPSPHKDRAHVEIHPAHSWKDGKVSYLCFFNSAGGQVMGESTETPIETLRIALDRLKRTRDIYTEDLQLVTATTLGLEVQL